MTRFTLFNNRGGGILYSFAILLKFICNFVPRLTSKYSEFNIQLIKNHFYDENAFQILINFC